MFRLIGVREVAGSNPVVPTKRKRLSEDSRKAFCFFPNQRCYRGALFLLPVVVLVPVELFTEFVLAFPGTLTDKLAVGGLFFSGVPDRLLLPAGAWAVTASLKPPAKVSTHIAPYSG